MQEYSKKSNSQNSRKRNISLVRNLGRHRILNEPYLPGVQGQCLLIGEPPPAPEGFVGSANSSKSLISTRKVQRRLLLASSIGEMSPL
jgi:hypothetical protein